MEDIFQYYGADWAGMIATFFSLWWLAEKRWCGFLVGGVAALCWVTFGYFVESIPTMLANVVFFLLNVRGLVKWRGARGTKKG